MNALATFYNFMNCPAVKSNAKNLFDVPKCAFGVLQIIHFPISTYEQIGTTYSSIKQKIQNPNSEIKWKEIAADVAIIFGRFSIILNAALSRPGVWAISQLVGRVTSPAQLNRLFGPNTIFAHNPYHPRHVLSFVAVVLATPALAQASYTGLRKVYAKCKKQNTRINTQTAQSARLSCSYTQFMCLYNTITARPVLHICNELVSKILHRA
jgi:hypothetical protein